MFSSSMDDETFGSLDAWLIIFLLGDEIGFILSERGLPAQTRRRLETASWL